MSVELQGGRSAQQAHIPRGGLQKWGALGSNEGIRGEGDHHLGVQEQGSSGMTFSWEGPLLSSLAHHTLSLVYQIL